MKCLKIKKGDKEELNGKKLKKVKHNDKDLVEVWAQMEDGSEHVFRYLEDTDEETMKKDIEKRVEESIKVKEEDEKILRGEL